MYSYFRCRITTVLYFCFIAVFLGSFILFTPLSMGEQQSHSGPQKPQVTAKPLFFDKMRKLAQPNKIPEPASPKCKPLHFIPDAATRPVTALASFPGSGNTWLRYLIQQSTGVHTGSQYLDKRLKLHGFPGESVFDASVAVVKTHEWGPKIRKRFQKAVLLIRHPKPTVQAFYNLWRGKGHVGVAPQHFYEKENGEEWRKFVLGYTNDWQSMNLDWIYNFTGPLHIILYDQLRDDLGPTLRSLVEFLDLPLDETAIQCTLEHPEGNFHRQPRTENFDPFSEELNKRTSEVGKYVFNKLENYLKMKPESS